MKMSLRAAQVVTAKEKEPPDRRNEVIGKKWQNRTQNGEKEEELCRTLGV
jgi:hypothetical protein